MPQIKVYNLNYLLFDKVLSPLGDGTSGKVISLLNAFLREGLGFKP